MKNFNRVLIEKAEVGFIKTKMPVIQVGDFVRFGIKVEEAGKERIQFFEGLIISLHKNGINTTVTVKNTRYKVLRVFPINATCLTNIIVLKKNQKLSK